MKRYWKIIIPVAILLIGVVAGLIAAGMYEPYNLLTVQQDPAAQLQRSFEKTKEALKEGMVLKLPDTVPQALQNGSIELSYKTEADDKISSTIYLRENGITVTGTATPAGQDPTEYSLWMTKEAVALEMPDLLEDKTYGFNPSTLREDLKDSPLLDVLGISYEDAIEMLDAAEEMSPESKQENSDWATMLKAKAELQALVKACAVSVANAKVQMDPYADPVDTYQISYAMSPDQLCQALDISANWVLSTESYDLAAEEYAQRKEEVMAELEQAKKDILASNATCIVDFYLHSKTQIIIQTVLRLDWFVDTEPARLSAVLRLGEDPVATTLYNLEIALDIPEEKKEVLNIAYHRSHAHNLPGRKLVITTNNESVDVLELQFNALSGAFEMKFLDREYELSGQYKEEEKQVTVVFNLESDEKVVVSFQGQASAPSVPMFINLCTLPQEDLDTLIGKFLPEEDWEWMEADITITDKDGYMSFAYFAHSYTSIGELLVAEGVAVLDEQGRIEKLCDEDLSGEQWNIYIQDELIEGNLYEVIPENSMTISILEKSIDSE